MTEREKQLEAKIQEMENDIKQSLCALAYTFKRLGIDFVNTPEEELEKMGMSGFLTKMMKKLPQLVGQAMTGQLSDLEEKFKPLTPFAHKYKHLLPKENVEG